MILLQPYFFEKKKKIFSCQKDLINGFSFQKIVGKDYILPIQIKIDLIFCICSSAEY